MNEWTELLSDARIRSFMVDRKGNLWACTTGKVLSRLKKTVNIRSIIRKMVEQRQDPYNYRIKEWGYFSGRGCRTYLYQRRKSSAKYRGKRWIVKSEDALYLRT